MGTWLVFEARFQAQLYGSPAHSTDLSRVCADRRRDCPQCPPLPKQFQHAQPLPTALLKLFALLRRDPAPVVLAQLQSRKRFLRHEDGRSEVPIDRKGPSDQSVGVTALVGPIRAHLRRRSLGHLCGDPKVASAFPSGGS